MIRVQRASARDEEREQHNNLTECKNITSGCACGQRSAVEDLPRDIQQI